MRPCNMRDHVSTVHLHHICYSGVRHQLTSTSFGLIIGDGSHIRLIIDYDRYVLAYTHNLRAASLVSIRNSSKNMNSYL